MIYFGLFLLAASILGKAASISTPQRGLTLSDIDQKDIQSDNNKTCADDQSWWQEIKEEPKFEEIESQLQDRNCPNSNFMGKLCKTCKPEYSMAIGSSNCIECDSNIHLLLIIFFCGSWGNIGSLYQGFEHDSIPGSHQWTCLLCKCCLGL